MAVTVSIAHPHSPNPPPFFYPLSIEKVCVCMCVCVCVCVRACARVCVSVCV